MRVRERIVREPSRIAVIARVGPEECAPGAQSRQGPGLRRKVTSTELSASDRQPCFARVAVVLMHPQGTDDGGKAICEGILGMSKTPCESVELESPGRHRPCTDPPSWRPYRRHEPRFPRRACTKARAKQLRKKLDQTSAAPIQRREPDAHLQLRSSRRRSCCASCFMSAAHAPRGKTIERNISEPGESTCAMSGLKHTHVLT
jgi:hypothetical protein